MTLGSTETPDILCHNGIITMLGIYIGVLLLALLFGVGILALALFIYRSYRLARAREYDLAMRRLALKEEIEWNRKYLLYLAANCKNIGRRRGRPL